MFSAHKWKPVANILWIFLQAFGSLFFLVTSWYVVDDKLAADRAILSEIEAEESDEDDEDDDEDDDSEDVVRSCFEKLIVRIQLC